MKLSLNIGALNQQKDVSSLSNSSSVPESSTPPERMDTSEDQVVKSQVPSLQLGPIHPAGGFSLNLSGIGTKKEESTRINVEEEDEFDSEDIEESPKVFSSPAIPKFNLKLPTTNITSDAKQVNETVIANTKIDSIIVDLVVPNLCTLKLDTNIEDVKTQIETELDNTIKREDLELFILQPINSLDDIGDSNRIVCRTKNSYGKYCRILSFIFTT